MFEEMDATPAHGDLAKVVHTPEPLNQTAANTEPQPIVDDEDDEGEYDGMHI